MLVAFGILLWSAYDSVRDQTISEFNKQQLLLAQAAALGISQQVSHIKESLLSLSQSPDVIEMSPQGQQVIQRFASVDREHIKALTRMDANGIILYTFPYVESSIGADISQQAHVKKLLADHEPCVSEVFRAVQGYDAIAIHVPVFNQGEFAGSVAALIPFDQLAEKFLKEIQPSKSGYAWVIGRDGTELYCPVPGHTGHSVFETSGDFPSIIEMAEHMMRKESGSTTYTYNRIGNTKIKPITKHAAYYPVDLGNTYWSIVVATPEQDVLATMEGFRNQLLLILLLFIVASTLYSVAVIRNVTALHESRLKQQAEHEKAQLILQYLQAQKLEAVGRLAAGIAHDLNNLMTPVLGFSDLLLDDPGVSPDAKEQLQDIRQAALKARDLIKQLLLFARTQGIKGTCLDINKLLRANENLLRGTIREDVELEIELQASPATILADAGQIEQSLMNLVINAQDAMPDGGAIRVSTHNVVVESTVDDANPPLKPGSYLVLRVSDTGMGINEETMPLIFDPFFTTKEAPKGTGLGLSSVHGIVSQHNGSVQVESKIGLGTAFSLFFPLKNWEKPEVVNLAPDSSRASPPKHRILVVEDDKSVRTVTVKILLREGYDVIAAKNGKAALALLAEVGGAISLLLTDVIMPELDGKGLSLEIKRRYPGIKVLFMSGYSSNDAEHRSLLDETDHSIEKPFTRTALLDEIDKLLRSSSQ